MSRLLDTAQRAFDAVPFYSVLYRVRPEVEDDVPFISHVAFHRARGTVDCIARTAQIIGAVPAYRRGLSCFPLTVLESEEEWQARLGRLRHALGLLGVGPEAGLRFALVADDATGPFASEISNFLAWDRAEGSIVFLPSSGVSVSAAVGGLAPDVVLVVSPDVAPEEIAHSGRKVVTVRHVGDARPDPIGFDRLLVCDELFVLGAARAGQHGYWFDLRSVVPEAEPRSGLLAVTTPEFTCFPLVRYCLGRKLALAGS
jgi:hypothetical protein